MSTSIRGAIDQADWLIQEALDKVADTPECHAGVTPHLKSAAAQLEGAKNALALKAI